MQKQYSPPKEGESVHGEKLTIQYGLYILLYNRPFSGVSF